MGEHVSFCGICVKKANHAYSLEQFLMHNIMLSDYRESSLFAAESKEAQTGWCNFVHMDCLAGIYNNSVLPVV